MDVKRLQRSPIQVFELLESGADLLVGLRRQDVLQRRNMFPALDVQHFAVGSRNRAASSITIDSQPGRDGSQPTTKGGRIPQRADLAHRLQEHILA